jgi:PAS domain S-box-containing protein
VVIVALLVLAASAALLLVGISSRLGTVTPSVFEVVAIALALAGAVLGLAGVAQLGRELETRERIETQLRESESKFAGILSIAADAIVTVDESQRILHFNQGAEKIFGWEAREALGEPLEILIPERFRERHGRFIEQFGRSPEIARRMGERRPIFGLRRDGTEFPAEASISRLDVSGGRLYTVVMRDITEQRRREDEERFLLNSLELLASSLDYDTTLRSAAHLPVPAIGDCCVVDVLESEGSVRRIVSVHDDPVVTRQLRQLEHRRIPLTETGFPVGEVLSSGRPTARYHTDAEWMHGGGDTMHAILREIVRGFITVPLVARDRVFGAITVISTDRARQFGERERALLEALGQQIATAIDSASLYRTARRATLARDEILGVVSHDLRNPLSAIAMCARVLSVNPPDKADDRRELASAILESTDMMNRLIEDLLDVSTIESGNLRVHTTPERVSELVERAHAMVVEPARDRGVVVEMTVDADLPTVTVDPTRIVQVLGNLASNAVRFTERGGRVTISARGDGERVVLSVQDTGAGISAEHLPHIFDRYWHANRKGRSTGTGLGLAIARGIVEAHGSRLVVESAEGVGSTFHFALLPVPSEAIDPPAPSSRRS